VKLAGLEQSVTTILENVVTLVSSAKSDLMEKSDVCNASTTLRA